LNQIVFECLPKIAIGEKRTGHKNRFRCEIYRKCIERELEKHCDRSKFTAVKRSPGFFKIHSEIL